MKTPLKLACYSVLLFALACAPQPSDEEERRQVMEEMSQVVNADSTKKKIKLAILLDTSNSMDGLIEQAKNQLWKIVTELAKAKDDQGRDPEIELALYQYGNDDLSLLSGYVQQVSGFTTELDEISEKLFALTTNGGSEYCGTVIDKSLNELTWSESPEDLQIIYIAGNEGFNQGYTSFESACKAAVNQNVAINTIYCGPYDNGLRELWKAGADQGLGMYANIDSDAKSIHVDSPFDQEISDLNQQLNQTYIPYGALGSTKKQKQITEDQNAQSYGSANATKRYISKGSKVYKNTSWDLVDASDDKGFDLSKISEEQLPEEMRGLSMEAKLEYIEKEKEKRKEIKSRMATLNQSRETYVAEKREVMSDSLGSQLEDVLIDALKTQAKGKAFYFENKIN